MTLKKVPYIARDKPRLRFIVHNDHVFYENKWAKMMKKAYYIDYPQEHLEGQMHSYRCVYCKEVTTTINGRLEGHLPSCEYRLKQESKGYEAEASRLSVAPAASDADDFD